MATRSQPDTEARTPLSRDRVLTGAVEVADEGGLDALTMRNLAAHLGVEAMSLYHHVANKETLLDGVAEMIIGEVNRATADLDGPDPHDWKGAMRRRILTAREVMLHHKWAPALLETRTTMTPELLFYFDGILEILRRGGVTYDVAHHALHALGSRALGFHQELFQPTPGSDDEEVGAEMLEAMASRVPRIVEMLDEITHAVPPESTLGWCDSQTEFEFGLDLILDGVERRAASGGR